jgi:ketohexokinase
MAEDAGKGRLPDTTMRCIRHVRETFPEAKVSVEIEKPGRAGLQELAAEADVVFYSKSWAEACVFPEKPLRRRG